MLKNLEERINTIQLPPSKPNPFETLTESEFGVLELIISGCSAPEIAGIQSISKNTVRIHKKKIYSKAGIPGKDPNNKCRKATILYMIYHPKSFLDSYTKEELENVKLIDDLTPRQLSVLEYYIMGFSYKKIADKLKISKNTVHSSHMPDIFYKLYLEEKDITRKNIKAMRLYILRYPEIIPSLYSQVKHLTAKRRKCHSKKDIDIELILSNIKPNQDLTPRELEILDELIKDGSNNKEIAYRFFISRNTLRSHIRSINKKWHIALSGVGTHEGKAIRTARQQIYTKALEMYKIEIGPILSNITPSPYLTPRELEVLDGLIEGESNKELTDRLFISKNTLRSHIKSINEKWDIKWEGVGTREATRTARQQTYTKALEMHLNSKK
jgi:DNA-binding NarL/FixJ family response regulator